MLSPSTSVVLSLCPVTVISGVVLPQSLSEVRSNFWHSCVLLCLGCVGVWVCEMAPGVLSSFPLVKVPAPCSCSSTTRQGRPYGSAPLRPVKALENSWCEVRRGRSMSLINQGFITDMLSIFYCVIKASLTIL